MAGGGAVGLRQGSTPALRLLTTDAGSAARTKRRFQFWRTGLHRTGCLYRLAQQGQAQRKRDEKAAGVDHDPRTAAGQREIQIRGPAVDKRASLADYANLIHRQTDRTPPRLLALERFDTLWHRAHCGLMATPRYERGVDTSRKIASVPEDRAESLRLIDGVKARIGEEMFAILFHRVINGHSFAWMASQGMGESERLGVLFLAAIDATARHFGLRERSRAVETMEQQIGNAA